MTSLTNTQKSCGKYYIGLMSGTSADGIDLALVDFTTHDNKARLVASYYHPYNEELATKVTSLYQPGHNEIDRAFHLDIELAQLFSQAIAALLNQEKLEPADIIAIGNHGQTIRHRPSGGLISKVNPFTLQIGCCQTLATLSGIRVIGQFRRKDMVLGGQGAPLVPIFHQQLFEQATSPVFVVNIGGIANVTFLPSLSAGVEELVLGFDTGPGNALLNDWYIKNHPNSADKFDKNGTWAATGIIIPALLNQFMQDEYIQTVAPKSTGREYFHLAWLEQQLTAFQSNEQNNGPILDAANVQATLLAFTVSSIYKDITNLANRGKVYLCGGGVHNTHLVNSLCLNFNNDVSGFDVKLMSSIGVDGDQLEAMAFAWLAYAFDHKLNSNMPAVTGASASCTLGNEFLV
ncbi:anhydro-N-acetylmuramic acid kinase [Colwellia echini]|uniref:Anhydro-N-acetylmuramic acid kinase n=1 Tax=Colwellia echini TaxID=1982103 RepID=A0ABY3N0K4_9GAMM|nr:anhydro-N-acetylmuramic acid kinase [Colwellia echini]TYK67007.1 anhydro-N-acetylmuramic acid kinase [Colwellia echini]